MQLIQRVTDILLKPKETWPVIDRESTDIATLYTQYVMILAAIPAVATFLGLALFGMSVGWLLVSVVTSYLLSLVSVFVIALIVDALAPTFGGSKSQMGALKLVAYSMTASWVGGISALLPMLAVPVMLLAMAYGLYLLFLGLPVLMKCAQDKVVPYLVVVILVSIVAMWVVRVVSRLVLPTHGALLMGDAGTPWLQAAATAVQALPV